MAFTAYPDDVGENPNIVASNDGINWVVPAGLTNPIDPLPGDVPMVNGSRYNSDTDLVHHDGTLYVFWRLHSPELYKVWVRTSTDGSTWTPRQTVIEISSSVSSSGRDLLISPTVMYHDDRWHMWTGDNTRPQKLWYRTAPTPTGPWTPRQLCTLLGIEDYRQVWHFDAVRHDGLYIGLFTLMQFNATNIRGVLYLAVSRDGITWQLGDAIVSAPNQAPGIPRTWDAEIIYRCSGVIDGDTLRLWYATAARIGYTEVPLSKHLAPALAALDAALTP